MNSASAPGEREAAGEPLFAINAVNMAEHSDNPVHTTEGGIAAGFAGAIVAGTTVYAYLARAAAELYGSEWATCGGGILTLRAPVLDDALVAVRLTDGRLAACVGELECARLVPRPPQEAETALPDEAEALSEAIRRPSGQAFEPIVVELDERLTGYAVRCGEQDPRYADLGLVHPVVWPVLANAVFARYLVRGPWVHTRSDVFHVGRARPGDTVTVESAETGRFTKPSGERAVVAVRFTVDDEPVTIIEHEAII